MKIQTIILILILVGICVYEWYIKPAPYTDGEIDKIITEISNVKAQKTIKSHFTNNNNAQLLNGIRSKLDQLDKLEPCNNKN